MCCVIARCRSKVSTIAFISRIHYPLLRKDANVGVN